MIDNIALGPSIGGLRMAEDVSLDECARLARAMTFKNAAAGLPHGGGKSVLVGDPAMSLERKELLIRGFAAALGSEDQYIFGPDMGTNEQCMAWIRDEIGRSVGLPGEIGGIPLDELGATGYGLAIAAEVAQDYCDLTLKGARVAVQGFGSVGIHAARFLLERGAVLVAAADSRASVHDPAGLDLDALITLKREGRCVGEYTGGVKSDSAGVIEIENDIWIPAARPDVIHAGNVQHLKTRLILQGANIPITEEAEAILHEKGVLSIPDFIANAGGVICAAMEYLGAGRQAAFEAIREKVSTNTRQVLESVRERNILPRTAAVDLARRRLEIAMNTRRWGVH